MRSLRTRIEALEAVRRDVPRGRYGVVSCLPGETLDGAAARAEAEGYVGCLVVPGVMQLADWLTMVEADHHERERRNYEIVGDLIDRAPRNTFEIIGR